MFALNLICDTQAFYGHEVIAAIQKQILNMVKEKKSEGVPAESLARQKSNPAMSSTVYTKKDLKRYVLRLLHWVTPLILHYACM